MYNNLIKAMDNEKVTQKQISELLQYRHQTVSDIMNGSTQKGFSFEDAKRIHKTFFPQHDIFFLFERT